MSPSWFLVACTRLYKSLCRSVGPSVCPSVGPSRFTFFCKVAYRVACARLMATGLVRRDYASRQCDAWKSEHVSLGVYDSLPYTNLKNLVKEKNWKKRQSEWRWSYLNQSFHFDALKFLQ